MMKKQTAMEKSKSIETTLSDSLESPLTDLAIDYSELSLDSFLDNEAIKEIPIVKSVVGLIKGGLKVREIFFAKKLLTFLKSFHSGKISSNKREAFQSKFKIDSKYRNEVVEQLMVLNERFLEVEKSKILANLFLAHLNDKYDWPTFQSLAVCLNNLHLSGIELLKELEKEEKPFYKGFDQGSEEEALLTGSGIVLRWGTHLRINGHGQTIYYYGIKGDLDFEPPSQE